MDNKDKKKKNTDKFISQPEDFDWNPQSPPGFGDDEPTDSEEPTEAPDNE